MTYDGHYVYSYSGNVAWQEKTYVVSGSGSHTLKWRYVKDGTTSDGDDCGCVDWVQWTGPLPQDPPATSWRNLTYTYDAGGRRIEKKYNGDTVLKYVYDGDSCIAEYDASGNLRRKYIYGPGIDQPVCMIEATVSPAATYYYHFDGSGNVVALTNSSGNTVDVYEYAVYGKVGASDPSHPNRFMFTGREFDKETGLYYYRARYYKPEIGRFLQADEVGYEAGMNLYRYCDNNPWNLIDPYGADGCEPNHACPDRNACSGPPPDIMPVYPRPTYPPIAGTDPGEMPGTGGGGGPTLQCDCICCDSGGPGFGFGPPGWVNPSKGGKNKGRGDSPYYNGKIWGEAELIAEYNRLRRSRDPDDRREAEKIKEVLKHKGWHGISTCVAALVETMNEASKDLKDPHNVLVLGGCVCLCIIAAAVVVVPK